MTGDIEVQAPYGIAWVMSDQAWARLQARLGPKAHQYRTSLSSPSAGCTGAGERTSA